jgi:upstream activation factor subunit UAF30
VSTARKTPAAATKRLNALHKPLQPSPELAALVGDAPISRSAALAVLWRYIRTHGLQDPADRRQILADDTLRQLFGGRDKVSMFDVVGRLGRHLS